jgi:hypothetical protein
VLLVLQIRSQISTLFVIRSYVHVDTQCGFAMAANPYDNQGYLT